MDTPSSADTALQPLLRLAAAGEPLLVPIASVREILEVGRLTVIPHTPDFVRGVMNLRGAVIPVIDLAARFGLGVAAIERRSAIVVVEVPDETTHAAMVMGLLVDAVYEVVDADPNRFETAPSLGLRVPRAFVAGMVNLQERYASLLQLSQILAPAELARLIGSR